ncbi:MAG: hypothetical protein GF368_05400 [Candidatus Aenigmarchaeota archaeon]|nr:hypothetical protein [Candidatus Aenigmarchaeota archaeon]
MRIVYITTIILLVIVFSGCTGEKKPSDTNTLVIITQDGRIGVNAEIADNPEERQTGLMYREHLDEDSGMLFIFELERPLTFWMKNTEIPLDMIFASSDGIITEIKRDVQPCLSDPCPTYPSEYPNKYVLEVNSGFSDRNNIQLGDRLVIRTVKD